MASNDGSRTIHVLFYIGSLHWLIFIFIISEQIFWSCWSFLYTNSLCRLWMPNKDEDDYDDYDDDDDDKSPTLLVLSIHLDLNVRSHIIFLAPHNDTLVAPHLGWIVVFRAKCHSATLSKTNIELWNPSKMMVSRWCSCSEGTFSGFMAVFLGVYIFQLCSDLKKPMDSKLPSLWNPQFFAHSGIVSMYFRCIRRSWIGGCDWQRQRIWLNMGICHVPGKNLVELIGESKWNHVTTRKCYYMSIR